MIKALPHLLFAFGFLTAIANAQTPAAPATPPAAAQPPVKKVVTHYGPIVTKSSANLTINMGDVGFLGTLPFDEAFGISVPVSAELINVEVWYRLKPKPANENKPTDTPPTGKGAKNAWHKLAAYPPLGNSTNYQFTVPALSPNNYYQFFFIYKRKPDALDRGELTTATAAIIGPALTAKANSSIPGLQNFEFNDGEVTTIINAIKAKIGAYVATKKLKVEFSINNTQYKNLFNALENVSNAYETSRIYETTIVRNTASFSATNTDFRTYRNTYDTSGQTEDIKGNVKRMDAILSAFEAFIAPPLQNATPELVANYDNTCQYILNVLETITITGDPAYATLKGNIIQFVSSIKKKVALYSQSLQDASNMATTQSNSFVEIVVANLYNDIIIDGTTISGDFDTSASLYVSGDLGVAAIPEFSKVVPYFGTNIYFRPVNKNVTLAAAPDGDWFGRRFSLMFGISISSIAKANYRNDLFGSSFNLVTGAGLRITDYFRLNAGALWYQKLNENPLNSNSHIQPTFFVSFSIDLDVRTALDNLFPSRKTS